MTKAAIGNPLTRQKRPVEAWMPLAGRSCRPLPTYSGPMCKSPSDLWQIDPSQPARQGRQWGVCKKMAMLAMLAILTAKMAVRLGN
jgi:hypothetical protein